MDFHQLEAFVKVAQTKSFSKAADLLFLTQPTISSHILSLEKELEVRLFDRKGREVELTPFGRVLYNEAVKILRTKDEALFLLYKYMNKIEGELRLYSSSVPAVYILPVKIKKFLEMHPKLKIIIVQKDSMEVINSIEEEDSELGIVGTIINNSSLEYIPFCNDELVVISKFNLNNDEEIDFEELIRYPLVIREKKSGTRKTFERYLIQKGLSLEKLKIIAELGSTEAIIQAVKAGVGISVISNRAIEDYKNTGILKTFRIKGIKMLRDFYIVTKKGRTLSPNAESFINYLLNAAD
ncbi:selenium metabolism-associated LysR family transcriptional regulator [Thermovenabulum gondwanense]|uniref:HTH-type transcriptional activator CmpR n=1 Tax=Thermovenabulum gondwanense TaxID=520767 RepID=A0A161PVF3_9FIRM|nr:selenium metabolism-associated LysR family transcriptional regulator [Thermovenabulum gondwanense]KYO64484.1 HTH-type transcriptional activator CmpR [Thermovenabulum gondwanense]